MSELNLFNDLIDSDSGVDIENKSTSLEMEDKDSRYPLHHACRYGEVGLVKILLSDNRNIDFFTNTNLACKNDDMDTVKILITKNYDINSHDKFKGYRFKHVACLKCNTDIVKISIANKNKKKLEKEVFQPIYLNNLDGHIDIIEILIENKCDINASDEWGYQPIHLACQNGHIDIVKILIENKCDINGSDKLDGYQPIHLACKNGHIDIVKILIDNKCDVNSLSLHKESPVDIARLHGNQEIIDILLNTNPFELIANAMKLHCGFGCDHLFCRQSLENSTLKKGDLIGSGLFGKVYKYKISNTNREIVIKRTKDICEDGKNIEGNINKYLSRILHKNIVQYFGALEKSGKLCIFMEYLPGGSVKNLIDQSKWIEHSKVIKFSKQILDGLQFIHSQGIIHRDIKPDNMLLDLDETLKLTDFGISKSLRVDSFLETTTKTVTFCGSSNYLAPEILLGEPYYFPADIWSTGVSINHMITGKIPYHWLRHEAVMFKIATTKKIEFTPCQPISETMQSFINDLLTPGQLERPSANILLKHKIFEDQMKIR